MRWCLFIPNLLVLLALGMEQCCGCGTAVAKDASHQVCVLEDDDAELKQDREPDHALSECDPPGMPGWAWHEVIRLATADWVAPLQGAENWKAPPGVRLHRWLCRERC